MLAKLEISNEELAAIIMELETATETIRQCYARLMQIGTVRISENNIPSEN